MVPIKKRDITGTKLLGTSPLLPAVASILANTEEEVEGDGRHVTYGLNLGRCGPCPQFRKVLHQAHGDGKFVLCRGVLAAVGFNESFDGQPVLALATVGRVGPSVQLEGLADGT